jgi:hypothetical protein
MLTIALTHSPTTRCCLILQLKQPRYNNWFVQNPNIPQDTVAATKEQVDEMDFLYSQRIRSLRAVDDMVGGLGEPDVCVVQ